MSKQTVTWEEPPADPRTIGMPAIVEQLKTRPGQWARIEAKPAAAWNYAKRHPEIEIASRSNGTPNKAVYARYIGTESNDA